MSDTSAPNMLKASRTRRVFLERRYPTSPFHNVVLSDVTLASSISVRGPKWRTRILPNNRCSGSNVSPAEMTRSSDPGILVPSRIVVGEARTRKCQIGVERKPRLETRIVRPLNANSSTRTTRLCRPGIANEQQFRVDAQIPESHGRLNATKADGAEANLGTLCANERCHAIGRLSGRRINGDCSAACIVAVETCSGIHVDFSAAPRAEDCPHLRTHEPVRTIAGVQRIVRGDRELVSVRTHSECRAERSRPLDLGLGIHARHRLTDFILTRRREALPRGGSIQANWIQPISSYLNANRAFRVSIEEMAETSIGDSTARRDSPLGLFELIAILRIIKEEREVGEQVQTVSKHEAGGAEGRRSVRALKFRGDTLTIRLAAITGVQQSEPRE